MAGQSTGGCGGVEGDELGSGWTGGCDERWLAAGLQRLHSHEQIMPHEEERHGQDKMLLKSVTQFMSNTLSGSAS